MGGTNPQSRRHDAYIESDGKEHINHGMHEYSEADLRDVHVDYASFHKDDVVEKNKQK